MKIHFPYKEYEKFLEKDKTIQEYREIVLDEYPFLDFYHEVVFELNKDVFRDSESNLYDYLNYAFKNEDYSFLEKIEDNELKEISDLVSEKTSFLNKDKNTKIYFTALPISSTISIPYQGRIHTMIDLCQPRMNIRTLPVHLTHEYIHSQFLSKWRDIPEKLNSEEAEKFLTGVSLGFHLLDKGTSSYLTRKVFPDKDLHEILLMNRNELEKCKENEIDIKEKMRNRFEETGIEVYKDFIGSGPFFQRKSDKPRTVPRKAAHFIGYNLVKEILEKDKFNKIKNPNKAMKMIKSLI